jgi:hypothetical protein
VSFLVGSPRAVSSFLSEVMVTKVCFGHGISGVGWGGVGWGWAWDSAGRCN